MDIYQELEELKGLKVKYDKLQRQVSVQKQTRISELNKRIIELEAENKEFRLKYIEALKLEEENLTLQCEIIKLKKLIEKQHKHNERGAGRKKQPVDEKKVRKVKELRAERLTVKQIAEKMHCSMSTINRILRL